VCFRDISYRHPNATRCEECQARYRRYYKAKNKIKNRQKPGNPQQDKEILNFIRNKRKNEEFK